MLREFVWKTFENTGSLDAYVFFKEIEEKNRIKQDSSIAEEEAASVSN
ncbi:MAG: YqzL family protein [Clostridia bacterium]|nr:YqzL family protein [Clostridia bacterium]